MTQDITPNPASPQEGAQKLTRQRERYVDEPGDMGSLGERTSDPEPVVVRRTTVGRLIAHLRQLPPDREIVATFDEAVATEGEVAAELIIGALS